MSIGNWQQCLCTPRLWSVAGMLPVGPVLRHHSCMLGDVWKNLWVPGVAYMLSVPPRSLPDSDRGRLGGAAQVRHDGTVTWLAYWHDPVNKSSFKYVWLAANSTWKAEADREKYEKARRLKDHVADIRCGRPFSSTCALFHFPFICHSSPGLKGQRD